MNDLITEMNTHIADTDGTRLPCGADIRSAGNA